MRPFLLNLRAGAGLRARPDVLLAAAGVAVAVLLLVVSPTDTADGSYRSAGLLGVLLVSATAVPLAWRRAAPLTTLAASLAASVAVVATDFSPTSVQFTLALALGSAAAHTGRRTTGALALGGAAICVVAEELYVADGSLLDAATLSAILALPLLAGDLLRTERERARAVRERSDREAELRSAAGVAEAAVAREQLARDVHDVVGHHLSAIAVQAHAGRVALAGDPRQAGISLDTIADLAVEALSQTRQAITGEGPRDPGTEGIPALVAALRRDGVEVRHDLHGPPRRGTPLMEAQAFRIVQEALTNIRRHGAGPAELHQRFGPDALVVEVVNVLREPGPTANGGGRGVAGMAERAALAGGHLAAGPGADGRWHVRAELPFETSAGA